MKNSWFYPIFIFCMMSTHARAQAPNCGCPTFIAQGSVDCHWNTQMVLHWGVPNFHLSPWLLNNVEVNFQNPTVTGTFPFSGICENINGTGIDWAYGSIPPGAAVQPTGTLSFPNGLTCTYSNGHYVSHTPQGACPVDCESVMEECETGILSFAKNYYAPLNHCQQWDGPCNTDATIHRDGPVSIGTEFQGLDYKLIVRGGIITEQLKICNTEWCDYVFDEHYNLMPLPELDAFIRENHHLPGCTPGSVIEEAGGFEVETETKNQQEKIEEIYLHLISMKKRMDDLDGKLNCLEQN